MKKKIIYRNIPKSEFKSFIQPMESGILTSSFGNRINPISGKSEFHNGLDIAVPEGTSVLAVTDGKVTESGTSASYGNYVKYDVGNDTEIMYAHLKCVDVEEGERIIQGQKVAESGCTGNVTGPHLHYIIYRNGSEIDPMRYVDYDMTDDVKNEYKTRGQAIE